MECDLSWRLVRCKVRHLALSLDLLNIHCHYLSRASFRHYPPPPLYPQQCFLRVSEAAVRPEGSEWPFSQPVPSDSSQFLDLCSGYNCEYSKGSLWPSGQNYHTDDKDF